MGEPEPSAKKEYKIEEIRKHTTPESCWLIIGNASNGGPKVYDVTKYLDDHPGGAEVMLDVAGQDADEFFEDIGHSKDAREELKKYYIGDFYMDEETKLKMQEQKKNAQGGRSPIATFLIVGIATLAVILGMYFQQQ